MNWPKSRTYHGRTTARSRRPWSHIGKRKHFRRTIPVSAFWPLALCSTWTCRICRKEKRTKNRRKPRSLDHPRVFRKSYGSAFNSELERSTSREEGKHFACLDIGLGHPSIMNWSRAPTNLHSSRRNRACIQAQHRGRSRGRQVEVRSCHIRGTNVRVTSEPLKATLVMQHNSKGTFV